jgi:hypothetical protein
MRPASPRKRLSRADDPDAEAAMPPDKRAQFRQRLSARLALDLRHRWTDTEMAEATHQWALLEPDANEGDDNGGG